MTAVDYVLSHRGERVTLDGAEITAHVQASPMGAPNRDGGAIPEWTPTLLIASDLRVRPGSQIRLRGRCLAVDTVTRNPGYMTITTKAQP